jgi:hypothetical protein
MPKPACIRCQRFFRVKQNGYRLGENMPRYAQALPGTAMPHNWQPYKVWQCDLWECEGCGALIAAGYGGRPLAEDWEPQFKEALASVQGDINDC